MIKLLLSFLLMTNIYAITPDELFGCFKTLEHNGRTVTVGPDYERNLSLYEDFSRSETYRNLETNEYEPINVFTFYTGYDEDGYYSYSPLIIFQNMGEFTYGEDSLSYVMDEDIYMLNSRSYQYKKVDHKVSLEVKRVGEVYTGRAEFISEIRRFNRSFTFKLKREECPTLR